MPVFVRQLIEAWSEHRIASLSAALAYYMLFSLAPILLICIALMGVFLSPDIARGEVLAKINRVFDPEVTQQIQMMLETAHQPKTSALANGIGGIVLVMGASGLFGEIQGGLNLIWGVKAKPDRSLMSYVSERILSFAMVLLIASLLLLSVVLSTFLTFLSSHVNPLWSQAMAVQFMISGCAYLLFITVLFALMFKILPDVQLKWRDVWLGAFITALMFIMGKFLLGIYLEKTQIATAFGAAGSIIVILVWVYYSAQIFFIGAEITKLYATRHHRKITPTKDAMLS